MPNIMKLLQGELLRLSRRPVRSMFGSLKREVLALKRVVVGQQRRIDRLGRNKAHRVPVASARLATPRRASAKELRGSRLGPRQIRSQRARLKLSRTAFAKILGVSPAAVFTWESGRSKPRPEARAAIIALRKEGRQDVRRRLGAIAGANRVPRRGPGRRRSRRRPPRRRVRRRRSPRRRVSRKR